MSQLETSVRSPGTVLDGNTELELAQELKVTPVSSHRDASVDGGGHGNALDGQERARRTKRSPDEALAGRSARWMKRVVVVSSHVCYCSTSVKCKKRNESGSQGRGK